MVTFGLTITSVIQYISLNVTTYLTLPLIHYRQEFLEELMTVRWQ